MARFATVAVTLLIAGAPVGAQQPQALSLLGRPLTPIPPSAGMRREIEAALRAAREAYDKNPGSADAALELGRQMAASGSLSEAIEIWTRGIEAHAEEPRLYRVRAKWYIAIRKFDAAIRDLSKATQLLEGKPDQPDPEPPNDDAIPTGSLKANMYYALGTAHYLKGNFSDARDAFKRCLDLPHDADRLVAVTDWLYMALRRMKQPDDARAVLMSITPGLQIVRSEAAYRLLLAYKTAGSLATLDALIDEKEPPASFPPRPANEDKDRASLTIAYGVANAHLYAGRPDDARKMMRHIVDKYADQWTAPPYLAAEADLARILKARRAR